MNGAEREIMAQQIIQPVDRRAGKPMSGTGPLTANSAQGRFFVLYSSPILLVV